MDSPPKTVAVYGVGSLFRRQWRAPTLLLGAGVGLEALEFYVTSSLMPSMVRDIGGLALFAWTTSVFVAALVLGGIAMVIRPPGLTLRQVYVVGALIFAVGCVVIGLAPSMVVVLAGRFLQGFGAGLLVTLAYSFIRFVYPDGMQKPATAFYSALWGISTLLGPSLGGMFAHGGAWRWAFFILVPLALAMAFLAPRYLPEGRDERQPEPLPVPQIVLIMGGILGVSYAGNVSGVAMKVALLAGGFAALMGVLVFERGKGTSLLPRRATQTSDPLALTFLAMFLLIVVLNSDIFVPYFLQTLHSTSPVVAGYVVALVATGWAAAGMGTASWQGRLARGAVICGPVLLFSATLTLALVISRHDPAGSVAWLALIASLLFSMGVGIGLAWAHLVSMTMSLAGDTEADKVTAAINLVPSLAAAFGSALCGVIVNTAGLVDPGGVEGAVPAAFWLYTLMSTGGLMAFMVTVALMRATDDKP